MASSRKASAPTRRRHPAAWYFTSVPMVQPSVRHRRPARHSSAPPCPNIHWKSGHAVRVSRVADLRCHFCHLPSACQARPFSSRRRDDAGPRHGVVDDASARVRRSRGGVGAVAAGSSRRELDASAGSQAWWKRRRGLVWCRPWLRRRAGSQREDAAEEDVVADAGKIGSIPGRAAAMTLSSSFSPVLVAPVGGPEAGEEALAGGGAAGALLCSTPMEIMSGCSWRGPGCTSTGRSAHGRGRHGR